MVEIKASNQSRYFVQPRSILLSFVSALDYSFLTHACALLALALPYLSSLIFRDGGTQRASNYHSFELF